MNLHEIKSSNAGFLEYLHQHYPDYRFEDRNGLIHLRWYNDPPNRFELLTTADNHRRRYERFVNDGSPWDRIGQY